MKKISLTIIAVFITAIAFSQNLTEKELIGEWEPLETTNVTGDSGYNSFAKGFKETLFEFKDNHRMNIQSLSRDYLLAMYLAVAKDAKWVIEADSMLIKIGDEERENSISRIKAYKEGRKIFFLLDDAIKIEVKKL